VIPRRARAEEARALAALAVRSKAHWPYPAEFVERFAATLGLSAEVIDANEVWVADRDGDVRGFCTLLHRADRTILDDLWLEPDEIGRGTGRLLFTHACSRAVAAGARVLEWEAEPYALGFYERMGGVVVGLVDSPLGRPLPRMRIPLGAC
jgi:GNAT superfamily N-acetyltransferase